MCWHGVTVQCYSTALVKGNVVAWCYSTVLQHRYSVSERQCGGMVLQYSVTAQVKYLCGIGVLFVYSTKCSYQLTPPMNTNTDTTHEHKHRHHPWTQTLTPPMNTITDTTHEHKHRHHPWTQTSTPPMNTNTDTTHEHTHRHHPWTQTSTPLMNTNTDTTHEHKHRHLYNGGQTQLLAWQTDMKPTGRWLEYRRDVEDVCGAENAPVTMELEVTPEIKQRLVVGKLVLWLGGVAVITLVMTDSQR